MDQTSKLKSAFKAEIRKTIKEIQNVNEMARVASTLKIGNLKAAEAYRDANKGKWVSDLIDQVIKSGDAGITQVDLATAIGKGSQQTINPKVRELIAAGVITQNNFPPYAQGTKPEKYVDPGEPFFPQMKEPKISPKSDDNEDDEPEIEDNFLKNDDDEEGGGEDEETLAAKASPNKSVQTDAKKLDLVIKQMRDLAAEYKTAKGTKRGNEIVAKLKDLNKEKLKLTNTVHKSLGDEEELDESKGNTAEENFSKGKQGYYLLDTENNYKVLLYDKNSDEPLHDYLENKLGEWSRDNAGEWNKYEVADLDGKGNENTYNW